MDPSIAPDDPENNPDLAGYVRHDRKIFELSDPIFRKVVSDLMAEKPDILLITGDLAIEGELVSHETVKGFLQQLENEGIKVFVIPGNNDISNSDAKNYKTDPLSQYSGYYQRKTLQSIIWDFGYNEALYRDANSLSYICQPFKWIMDFRD